MSVNPVEIIDTELAEICEACNAEVACLLSRKKKLCQQCFIRFIRGKQRKHMSDDRYKVKYGKQVEERGISKVLLCFSGGLSSLVLFDIIASLLEEQHEAHNGRQGFELIILSIDEFEYLSLNRHISTTIEPLISRYESVDIKFKVLDLKSCKINQDQLRRIMFDNGFQGTAARVDQKKEYDLLSLLDSCKDKSSAEDLLGIVYEEFILEAAYALNCQTIIFGHCMTRLANEVLGLSVKGRGSEVHSKIADHVVKIKEKKLSIIFPLRDILHAEIVQYSEILKLKELEVKSNIQKSRIVKNMTIRDLISQYLTNLDNTGYSSTASTVVKTAEKLGAPQLEDTDSNCQICGNKVHHDPKAWLNRITVSTPAALVTEEEEEYAKAYRELFHNKGSEASGHEGLKLCYGCTITLKNSKNETDLVWPLAPRYSEKDIIDEFTL